MNTKEQAPTKVITGVVRLSYANIWQPKSVDGEDEKYSASLLIPKTDKETIAKIERAVKVAKKEGVSKFGGKIPAVLKEPLRDGDKERPDDENYAGCYFLNANSSIRPGIVDLNRKPIEDQEEVYSGCYVRASLNFFAFNTNGNKGVGAGLNNLQKIKDGERLGGRSNAEDDFDDDFMLEFDDEFDEALGF